LRTRRSEPRKGGSRNATLAAALIGSDEHLLPSVRRSHKRVHSACRSRATGVYYCLVRRRLPEPIHLFVEPKVMLGKSAPQAVH